MPTEIKKSTLQLETLFKSAFQRTKSRFLSYFLTWVMFYAIGLGTIIAVALIVGLNVLVYVVTKSVPVTATVGFISTIAAITGFAYIGAWGGLATTLVLISEKVTTVSEAMKETKPLVWRYLGVSCLMALFIMGVVFASLVGYLLGAIAGGVVFAIAGVVLLIAWSVWGSFTIFAFLDEKKPNLYSMWKSKAIVSQRFWGILGRFLLVNVAVYVLLIILTSIAANYRILNVVTFVFSLLIGPFILSYMYEIYREMPKPEKVETSKVWLGVAIAGWVILVIVFVMGVNSAAKNAQPMMEDIQKQLMMKNVKSI